MRLDPFIIDLLFDHDCVIIPEFGGLVANYRSAKLNVVSHVISPPAKSIGFNPSLKYNDGLLTNYISATMGITYKQAAEQLAITIAEYQQALASEGRFSIDRIGVFYKDRLGQVQFIPEEQENFLLASYGLKPIQLKLVGGMETSDSTKIVELNSTGTRRWKIAAAILLPALLAGSWILGSRASQHAELGFAALNPFGEPVKKASYAPVETAWNLPMSFVDESYDYLLNNESINATTIDFVNGVADADGLKLKDVVRPQSKSTESYSKSSVSETADTRITPSIKQTKSVAKDNATYTLIGGAFGVKENGQKLINQLKAMGYDADFAGMRDNLHLVAYGHFNTRKEAEKVKARVQASGAKAWIRTNQ